MPLSNLQLQQYLYKTEKHNIIRIYWSQQIPCGLQLGVLTMRSHRYRHPVVLSASYLAHSHQGTPLLHITDVDSSANLSEGDRLPGKVATSDHGSSLAVCQAADLVAWSDGTVNSKVSFKEVSSPSLPHALSVHKIDITS